MNPKRLVALALVCLLPMTGSAGARTAAAVPSQAAPCVAAAGAPTHVLWWVLACGQQDAPYSELQARLDAGSLPTLTVVVPDKCHDGHKNNCPGGGTLDGQVTQADDYLASELPNIIASPQYQSGKLLVVVTFDEGHRGNQVYTVLLGATIRPGTTIDTHLTHYSLLAYVEQVAGVPCLNEACTAPPLTGAGL